MGRGYRLQCAYCEADLGTSFEMHEALISREPVQKSEHKDKIMVPENCILLCPTCHHSFIGIGGNANFERSVNYLVGVEGKENIRKWLVSMQKYFPTIARQTLARFEGVIEHGQKDEKKDI